MRTYPLLLLLAVFGLAACDSADSGSDSDPLSVERVNDLPADPTQHNPENGQPLGNTNRFTLYSLREGEVVLSYEEENRADSASAAWDIGFRGTQIIVNGGENGPGEGGIQIVDGTFEEVTEAPASGYADAPAENWYTYAGPPTHLITPVAGRVLVVRTADGRYAKVRILSYYRGAPAEPDGVEDEARHYTFEYVFQPDGSRSLEVAE